ncbi:transcription-repair coupling factor [Ichthyobacterium seriolicida]|uniref:Transcription-repair-coupling factor n=1 Tax=Ichthyobacterium seriolicida TaxID=242600 RepID=A0A1J1E8L7_9FLAO|nr:transcription-repair coupling factor [Ichthyobacterium seriolicida]
MKDKESAAYCFNELEKLEEDCKVLFFSNSYNNLDETADRSISKTLFQTEAINTINKQNRPFIVVSFTDAISEKLISKEEFIKDVFHLSVGDTISLDSLESKLEVFNFDRVDFVTTPGQFSIRGSIFDIFSFSNENPYRIDFFDQTINSIRLFDESTQLSVQEVEGIDILKDISGKHKTARQNSSIFDYMPEDTVVITDDLQVILRDIKLIFDNSKEKNTNLEKLFLSDSEIVEELKKLSVIEFSKPFFSVDNTVSFSCEPQPSFSKQFELLGNNLLNNTKEGIENIICCSGEKQASRLIEIFESVNFRIKFSTIQYPIHRGFVDRGNKVACYSDHQIFDRYQRFYLKNNYNKRHSLTLKEINSLKRGDLVTHIDYGIGRFGGLQKLENDGKRQEVIKLVYKDNDTLYISIHSLHKISKFNSKEGTTPKLTRLGSGSWSKIKKKTKSKIKDIAFDLIKLYAERKQKKGFAFSPDTYLQQELEASFIYEETPDQITAIKVVKEDMERDIPMDRLICGDVGFGKTEIAIRAAFKAVADNKQVAVLVPTTVLTFQHKNSFNKRLEDFPSNVECLNRFKTAKQKTEILNKLKKGEIDIIIGTHMLINAEFKDLGLLIIDEEQKFGVGVKDKLKNLKKNVDTLTLTATPIPRTLQFSLMGARDLSTLNTPPPNRQPIETQVITFDEQIIGDAISYEISRGGQVFFIHNRISDIKGIKSTIQNIVPEAKIGIGHGQMDGKQLEELILSFMRGEFDILISTTIIENGLDIPNANTLIVNNANNFGLSDLHQMRGRVGRSNKKAFCYFLAPPHISMSEESRKRLQILEEFSNLGSGFKIAAKDLEMRGAGDILGGEQTGFINDIGFDTYQKILNETIEELKKKEFKNLYTEDTENNIFIASKECHIDTDFEILFPSDYISNVDERLSLYEELSKMRHEEELNSFSKRIVDRFGDIPIETKGLLNSMRIKWKAKKLGLEKIILKNQKMVGYFISDENSPFFKSETFNDILLFLQRNHHRSSMKELKSKSDSTVLTMSISGIKNIDEAFTVMEELECRSIN